MKYDNVVVYPLLWQDDLFYASSSIEKAQEANDKLIYFVESKLLNLNLMKTVFLIAGKKKAREKLQEEVNASPLRLYNMRMKQVDSEKYLGMWLSSTTADSISTTVNMRIGLATRSIYEIRTIVEDCRANVLGGLSLAFHIFEACVIPTLLFSCEVWSPLPKKTLKSLTDFSNKFLKVILQWGNRGCQIAPMYWFTKTMSIENRILLQKVLFVHHLATLPTDSLAYEFYIVQKANPSVYPSVVAEVDEFLVKHNIQNILIRIIYS